MTFLKNIIRQPFFLLTAAMAFCPDVVCAIQIHGMPEGIYVHQIAHLFFMISMGFFIHWLRHRQLVKETGWRYIQYMAFFFILWNLDVFMLHFLDEQLGIIQVSLIDLTHIRIQAANGMRALEILYYIAQLDYLFCVPALFFLNLGLSHLVAGNYTQTKASPIKSLGLSKKDDR